MRYQSKNRRLSKKEHILSLIIIFSALFSFIYLSSLSKAESSQKITTYYISYEVQPGDTLWSIADEYMTPEDHSKADYITRIKELNHMLSDNIVAGNYIIISYNSYE